MPSFACTLAAQTESGTVSRIVRSAEDDGYRSDSRLCPRWQLGVYILLRAVTTPAWSALTLTHSLDPHTQRLFLSHAHTRLDTLAFDHSLTHPPTHPPNRPPTHPALV